MRKTIHPVISKELQDILLIYEEKKERAEKKKIYTGNDLWLGWDLMGGQMPKIPRDSKTKRPICICGRVMKLKKRKLVWICKKCGNEFNVI